MANSRRLLDLLLFARLNNLPDGVINGFKVWLIKQDDSLHHHKEDWEKLLIEYQNR